MHCSFVVFVDMAIDRRQIQSMVPKLWFYCDHRQFKNLDLKIRMHETFDLLVLQPV